MRWQVSSILWLFLNGLKNPRILVRFLINLLSIKLNFTHNFTKYQHPTNVLSITIQNQIINNQKIDIARYLRYLSTTFKAVNSVQLKMVHFINIFKFISKLNENIRIGTRNGTTSRRTSRKLHFL